MPHAPKKKNMPLGLAAYQLKKILATARTPQEASAKVRRLTAAITRDKEPKMEWVIESKKFRNKKTGEIVTQIPILEMDNFEEVK